jgi:hypothetical protein
MCSSPARGRALLLASSLLSAVLAARAVEGAPTNDAFLGEWEGTSSCVDKARFPACKDEVVVYHVTSSPAGDSHATMAADKVVDGKALNMGTLDFRFDSNLKAWTSELRNPSGTALWSFQVTGSELSGTLVDLPSQALIRRVTAKKR